MKHQILILLLLVLIISSCNQEQEIIQLLQSDKKEDVIKGAYKAGETKNKKYVPLLLKNPFDVRTSTNIQFKGYNVYQEKMIALKKIFNTEPPKAITDKPDSLIVKFYTELSQKPLN